VLVEQGEEVMQHLLGQCIEGGSYIEACAASAPSLVSQLVSFSPSYLYVRVCVLQRAFIHSNVPNSQEDVRQAQGQVGLSSEEQNVWASQVYIM
jgi:hypothetical protein